MAFSLACVTGAVYAGAMPVDWLPVAGAAAAVGSLLPDIDEPESKLGRVCVPLALVIKLLVGHRTLTHSALALATVILLPWIWLSGELAIAVSAGVGIGYASHLLGDAMTPQGIQLAWPQPARFSLRWFRTGSAEDHLAFFGLSAASIAAVLSMV
ncbi:hypothetical protein DS843_22690 [Roseomonas genomospecies 6]|uniref:Metal-dependent hydrolase n=1 Tax=Roseomonas genomospecies 6 TaxID=214106 RepID=A0A9W7KS67_9PROT|nr:metal-dependent hydrolase [Roseomonas genomospecies 6]KAA0677649.1 hypothetical protein DS843_22690 [Roseomonas genomospecies 6]